MTRREPRTSFPDRKISETFLHFAEPLLDAHGPHTTAAQMEQSLKLAFTIWNAVVYEDANGNSRFIDMVRNQTALDREIAAFVDQLIVRKQSLFGDDHRLIGEYKLTRKGDEWRLWAEARDPRSTSRATE